MYAYELLSYLTNACSHFQMEFEQLTINLISSSNRDKNSPSEPNLNHVHYSKLIKRYMEHFINEIKLQTIKKAYWKPLKLYKVHTFLKNSNMSRAGKKEQENLKLESRITPEQQLTRGLKLLLLDLRQTVTIYKKNFCWEYKIIIHNPYQTIFLIINELTAADKQMRYFNLSFVFIF